MKTLMMLLLVVAAVTVVKSLALGVAAFACNPREYMNALGSEIRDAWHKSYALGGRVARRLGLE